jgi:hypothetical protein
MITTAKKIKIKPAVAKIAKNIEENKYTIINNSFEPFNYKSKTYTKVKPINNINTAIV